MRKIVLFALVFCGLGTWAADLVIQSLDKDGRLIFTGIPYVSSYHIEQKPSLTGPWQPLLDVTASGTGSITSTVPLSATTAFFRVLADNRPIPEGMVEILAGTNIGTDPDYGPYSLTVETFCMDAKEVTKSQWTTVHNWAVSNDYIFDNAGTGKALNHPAVSINWYDCAKWCNARSEMEGKDPCYTVGGVPYRTGQSEPDTDFNVNGYRLPTYIEWEYAARGGLQDKRFPWGDTIVHSQANYYSWHVVAEKESFDENQLPGYHDSFDSGEYPYTSPIGYFAPNNYGLYDMAGNVWEWCNDAYDSTGHIIKSGSWASRAETTTCAALYYGESTDQSDTFGLRAVCR